MAFTIKDNPDFSWSSSRSRLFEECQLCYGLHYYGAHNGWLDESTPLAQAAYRYKVTRSTEQLLMDVITSNIYKHFYKDGVEKDEMIKDVKDSLNLAVRASRHNKDDWYNKPKQVPMLTEMIEHHHLPDDLVAKVIKKRDKIIKNFYESYTNVEVSTTRSSLLKIGQFNSFTLERMDKLKVFIGVHLIYQREDGMYVAVNFKTDNRPSHIDQLGSIALYFKHKYNVDLEHLILRDEFLLKGTHKDYHLTSEDIEEMYEVIEDSVGMMSELVVDGNLKRNQGLPMDAFSRNINHSDASGLANCPYCQLVKMDLEKYPNGVKSYAI